MIIRYNINVIILINTIICFKFRIPPGTSSDLSNLLFGLLKRNPKDRISFDNFFDHPFLKMKPPPVTMPSPLANSPKTPSVFDQGEFA